MPNPTNFWTQPNSTLRTHLKRDQPDPKSDHSTKTVIFIHGHGSSKESTYSKLVRKQALSQGLGFFSFDLLGHGKADGDVSKLLLSEWAQQVYDIITNFFKEKKSAIIVSHSMGGYLLALQLKKPEFTKLIFGVLLMAPAIDLTHRWMYPKQTEDQKKEMKEKGQTKVEMIKGWFLTMTQVYYEDAVKNCNVEGLGDLDLEFPVTIIQGKDDQVVPYKIAGIQIEQIISPQVKAIYLAKGKHAMTEQSDKDRVLEEIDALINYNYND